MISLQSSACYEGPYALFVSDIHINRCRPATTHVFIDFLRHVARRADALYILGDLFDIWLGDDDIREPHQAIVSELRELASKVPLFVLHGNHDFLLGEDFAASTGCTLLPDPTVIDLDGQRVILSHGDALCLLDRSYQRLRRVIRNRYVQKIFLSLPRAFRLKITAQLESLSDKQSPLKAEHITDVSPEAVAALLKHHDSHVLIHGHTHRPKIHTWGPPLRQFQRIVTGDWYEKDSVLVYRSGVFSLCRCHDIDKHRAPKERYQKHHQENNP